MTDREGKYGGAVVVIPTRNRASLAINALRSVLDQLDDRVQILVSDNSTAPSEQDELARFCETLAESRVRYVQPPRSLAMPAHWEWAMGQALDTDGPSHVAYLTDRMMFRRGALTDILALAARYPDKVISYNHDRICDDVLPIRVEQYETTGMLLDVESSRLISLFAGSILHHALPRMLNCIVPRRVFREIRQRFGTVFASIAPDFNFCFRCLDLEDSILFYDRSPLFHYALDRSNGASATRGESTLDRTDFEANLPIEQSIRNYATPIPSLITSTNAAFNEYLIYKRETGSARFVDVDLQKYLRANAVEVEEVRDPRLRGEMQGLLARHGYRADGAGVVGRPRAPWWATLRAVAGRVKRAALARLQHRPPAPEFATLDAAIHYLRYVSPGNLATSTCGADVLHARVLSGGQTLARQG